MDLEDYSDEELRSRYRFRLDSLEFLTEILKKTIFSETGRGTERYRRLYKFL